MSKSIEEINDRMYNLTCATLLTLVKSDFSKKVQYKSFLQKTKVKTTQILSAIKFTWSKTDLF